MGDLLLRTAVDWVEDIQAAGQVSPLARGAEACFFGLRECSCVLVPIAAAAFETGSKRLDEESCRHLVVLLVRPLGNGCHWTPPHPGHELLKRLLLAHRIPQ